MNKQNIIVKINNDNYTIKLPHKKAEVYEVTTSLIEDFRLTLADLVDMYKLSKNKMIIYLNEELVTYKIIDIYARSRAHVNTLLTHNPTSYLEVDDMAIEFKILSRSKIKETYKVQLIGAPKQLIQDLIDVTKSFKINLSLITTKGLIYTKQFLNNSNVYLVIDKHNNMFAIQNQSILYRMQNLENLPYLTQAIHYNTGKPIKSIVADKRLNIDTSHIINYRKFNLLKYTNPINLLPQADKKQIKKLKLQKLLMVESLLFFMLVILMPNLQILAKEQQLIDIETNINSDRLSEANAILQKLTYEQQFQIEYDAKVQHLSSDTLINPASIEFITSSINSAIKINQLIVHTNSTIELEGTYISYNKLMEYIDLLEAYLSNIKIDINQTDKKFAVSGSII